MPEKAISVRFFLLFPFILLICYSGIGQNVVCSAEDRLEFDQKIAALGELGTADMSNTVVAVGKSFLGSPYEAKTLEINEEEALVVNLHEFDCTTYVENVLVFSLMLRKEEDAFEAFTSLLQNLRYREGELDGYASRLHYFTDWISNNEAKGLVKDITMEIGGEAQQKTIDFMSSHRDLYPMLTDDTSFELISKTEEALSERTTYVLSVDQIAAAESQIRDGDIIALATSVGGLDVTHTGFALRHNGRIHLLHASSSGSVEISEKPLADYLKGVRHNTGIIVARPL